MVLVSHTLAFCKLVIFTVKATESIVAASPPDLNPGTVPIFHVMV